TNALIACDKDSLSLFIETVGGHDLAIHRSAFMRFVRELVTPQRPSVLLLARDVVRLSEELGCHTHHQRPARRALVKTRVNVDAVIHRQMMHMLKAADDLHVLE